MKEFQDYPYPLIYFILILLFYACANPMNPTGGPKDETPPVLIYSNPVNNSLNFKEQVIEMEFDEPIQVVGLKNELIITPTYLGDFDFKAKKYGLTVEFEEPFKDSTTYTLNFREAVSDITEGNPAENLKIAFSTWDFLDSLSINGTVRELLTGSPAPEYLVGIYARNDTLTPFNGPPLYFSKTDEAGSYSINNVKAGSYSIYAYNDKNNNLTIQSKTEKYGFLSEPIELDSSLTDINIEVQNLDLTELAILSNRQNGQYYEIRSSKYIADYQLFTPGSDSTFYSKYADDHKGIILYNTFQIPDSLEVLVTLRDSIYESVTDTLYVHFEETRRQKDDFNFQLKSATINKDRKIFDAELNFSKPIATIGFDSLFIEWDSIRTTQFDTSHIRFDDKRLQLFLHRSIDQNDLDSLEKNKEKPKLKMRPASFLSIENDSSFNNTQNVLVTEQKNYGIIRGSVSLDSVSYFIQLLNEQLEVEREFYGSGKTDYVFEDILPGKYRLRLLIDENNDGIWHPGNILENKMPERIHYFSHPEGGSELVLRANWELIDINVDSLVKSVEKPVPESE